MRFVNLSIGSTYTKSLYIIVKDPGSFSTAQTKTRALYSSRITHYYTDRKQWKLRIIFTICLKWNHIFSSYEDWPVWISCNWFLVGNDVGIIPLSLITLINGRELCLLYRLLLFWEALKRKADFRILVAFKPITNKNLRVYISTIQQQASI